MHMCSLVQVIETIQMHEFKHVCKCLQDKCHRGGGKTPFSENILSDHVGEKDQIIGIFMMLIIKNVLEPIQVPIRNHIVQLNHFQMPFQIQNTITPSLKI